MSDKTKQILGITGGVAVLICIAIMNSSIAMAHPLVHQITEVVLQVLAGLGVSTPIAIVGHKAAAPTLAESAVDKAASQK